MLNSDILDKGLEIVSQPQYSITRPNFIVWLPLFREILSNMCITIVCFQGYDVINFEILKPYLSNQAVFLHDQKVQTRI